jgi:SAM-dependent methyltransferase
MPCIRKISGAPGWKAAGALIVLVLAFGWVRQAPAAEATPIAKPTAEPAARPPAPAQPRIDEEIVKQEKIFRSRGADVPHGYVTSRTLSAYGELLPSSFSDALRKLRGDDRWLDIGAGGGQAILDYYAPEYDAAPCENCAPASKARAVALSIEDRRTDQWWQRAASPDGDGIRYLFGKRLREYSREELGKFQVITDVYGGFSYTENLSPFLERVLSLLEIDGGFYTLVQSVHLEDGKDNPDKTWYLTELVDAAGRDVKVCSWLKSIPCVKVACESKSTWETPTELIHIRKVCGDISVPRTKLLLYEAGNPPARRFQLER